MLEPHRLSTCAKMKLSVVVDVSVLWAEVRKKGDASPRRILMLLERVFGKMAPL